MQKKFLKYCERIGLNPANKLLIAVSGGLDSMALLHLFRLSGFAVHVAHCNFKLRGEESDGDEAFVKEVCAKYGIIIHTNEFDTEDYANSKSISIQMAARDLRYAWFEELRLANNLDYVATAHHQDDQIETLLINMSRGTGVKGMHGILAHQNGLIRPLLFTDRTALDSWMCECDFVFREDSSNTSVKYARNKLRHQVIPILKELNPSLSKTYQENAERFGSAAQNLAFFYEKQRDSLFLKKGSAHQISLSELLKYPSPLDVLFHFIDGYGFNDWMAIENLIHTESGKIVSSCTHELLKDRDVLLLREKQIELQQSFYVRQNQKFLYEPVVLNFSVHEAKKFNPNMGSDSAVLDFDKIQFPLELRRWRKGDVFKPLGMRGKKKLSDFFVDQKMSLFEKENVWLLCSSDEIIWIVGHRIDERFKLVETTQKVYLVQLN
jgi:tRNA(Ile)-lysidine synthase